MSPGFNKLQTSARVSLQRRGRHVAVQPVPVVPFMVQEPLISTGSRTYVMHTSLLEGGGGGEGWSPLPPEQRWRKKKLHQRVGGGDND